VLFLLNGHCVAFDPVKYLREVRSEAARVRWPTRKETVTMTGVVLLMAGSAALFFLVVDSLFGWVARMFFTTNS